jgi:hypothetical protein
MARVIMGVVTLKYQIQQAIFAGAGEKYVVLFSAIEES